MNARAAMAALERAGLGKVMETGQPDGEWQAEPEQLHPVPGVAAVQLTRSRTCRAGAYVLEALVGTAGDVGATVWVETEYAAALEAAARHVVALGAELATPAAAAGVAA